MTDREKDAKELSEYVGRLVTSGEHNEEMRIGVARVRGKWWWAVIPDSDGWFPEHLKFVGRLTECMAERDIEFLSASRRRSSCGNRDVFVVAILASGVEYEGVADDMAHAAIRAALAAVQATPPWSQDGGAGDD